MTDIPISPELADIITRLQAQQKGLGESANIFSARLGISASAWSRIQRSKYGARNQGSITSKLRSAIAILEGKQEAQEQRGAGAGKTLKLSMVQQALDGVQTALAEPRDRAVVVLAETGGGKTQTSIALQEHFGHHRVTRLEAGVEWRKDMEVVRAFAAALGVEEHRHFGPGVRAVTAEMKKHPRIFVIDEFHNIGREGINIIKGWMNTTECVFVLLAVPYLWTQICGRWGQEAAQFRCRVCAHLHSQQLEAEDVRFFLSARLPQFASLNGSSAKAVDLVRRSGNAFGFWDTVERIATNVYLDAGDDALSLDMFQAAVAEVERMRAK